MVTSDQEPLTQGKKRGLTLNEQFESGGWASLASMEGAWSDLSSADTALDKGEKNLPWIGILSAIIITGLAYWVNQLPFAPFTIKGAALEHPLGISMLAILLGMAVANILPAQPMKAGCRWITVWCIPVAVVALGAGMNLGILTEVGWVLLAIILLMMLVAIGVAYVVGRAFGLSHQAAYLLGVGTSVCGSSAILAVSPVSGADDDDVLVTVGTVNLVGLLAMFSCVGVLYVMPLDAQTFGAWAGVSIHAVPQVIAAGGSHSADAAVMASLVKLVRVALLAPVVMLTALFIAKYRKKSPQGEGKRRKLWHYVPWFVWGFLALATVRELGGLPILEFMTQNDEVVRVSMEDMLLTMAKWLLAVSMAAIGLQVQLKLIFNTGAKAMAAGVITWLVMSAVALWLLQLTLGSA